MPLSFRVATARAHVFLEALSSPFAAIPASQLDTNAFVVSCRVATARARVFLEVLSSPFAIRQMPTVDSCRGSPRLVFLKVLSLNIGNVVCGAPRGVGGLGAKPPLMFTRENGGVAPLK